MLMFGDAMSILARSTCDPSGNSPGPHPAEEIEVLLDRPVAVRTFLAGLGERAAIRADLLGRQAVDIRLALRDEVLGVPVQLLEIV